MKQSPSGDDGADVQATHHVRTITFTPQYRNGAQDEPAERRAPSEPHDAIYCEMNDNREYFRAPADNTEESDSTATASTSATSSWEDAQRFRADAKDAKEEAQSSGSYLMTIDGNASPSYIGGRLATFQMTLAREVGLESSVSVVTAPPASSSASQRVTPEEPIYSTLAPRYVMHLNLEKPDETYDSG